MNSAIVSELVTLGQSATLCALDALSVAVGGAERIARHQFSSARALVRDSVEGACVLVRSEDQAALETWRESVLEPLVLRFLDDSRRHFELSVDVQRRITDIADARCTAFSTRSSETLMRLEGLPTDDTQQLFDSLRHSIHVSELMLEEMRRATHELRDLAEAGAGPAAPAECPAFGADSSLSSETLRRSQAIGG